MKPHERLDRLAALERDARGQRSFEVRRQAPQCEDHPPGLDRSFPWYDRATIFGTFAEALADSLKPDMKVALVGHLEERGWTGSDGAKHSRVGLMGNALKILQPPSPDLVERDQAGQARLKNARNHVLAMGDLTQDTSLHDTHSGRKVAKLRIAVNERRKGEDHTGFYSALAWGDLAVEAVHLTMGLPVILTGRLVVESCTTRDWQQRNETKLEAHRIDRVATPPRTPAPPPERPYPRLEGMPRPSGAEAIS